MNKIITDNNSIVKKRGISHNGVRVISNSYII